VRETHVYGGAKCSDAVYNGGPWEWLSITKHLKKLKHKKTKALKA